MLAGGSEASITPFAIAGFQALTALSITEDPTVLLFHLIETVTALSWEKVLVCWCLKVWNTLKTGATILAEVVGYGNT